MISLSISLLSLTLVYFILGMFKPNWALLGMKKPSRIWVIVISVIALMISFTLYGEGSRRKQEMLAENSVEQPAKSVVVSPVIVMPTTIVTPTTIMPPISEPVISTKTAPSVASDKD